MSKGVKLYTVKDGYELGDNIASKVLAFAFGLSAEIERNLISQRTKEALMRKKSEGKKLGRKIGSRNLKLNKKCKEKHNFILTQLKKRISIPKIASMMGVAKGTLYRYLAYTDIRMPTGKENNSWQRGIY